MSFTKRCSSRRTFDQEVRALTAWRCEPMPVLLRADPSTLDVEMTRLAGSEPPVEDIEVWRAAGAWRRRFMVEQDEDDMPLSVALQRRLDSWSGGGHSLRGEHADVRRVRCHRDFQPQNWLWSEGTLGVVDFEHAAPDHPLTDLVKVLDHLPMADSRFAAFVGGPLSEGEVQQLLDLRLLHGLATLAWGRRHEDEGFIALGQRVLAELQRAQI